MKYLFEVKPAYNGGFALHIDTEMRKDVRYSQCLVALTAAQRDALVVALQAGHGTVDFQVVFKPS